MLSEPEPGMIGKSARGADSLAQYAEKLLKRELFAVEVSAS